LTSGVFRLHNTFSAREIQRPARWNGNQHHRQIPHCDCLPHGRRQVSLRGHLQKFHLGRRREVRRAHRLRRLRLQWQNWRGNLYLPSGAAAAALEAFLKSTTTTTTTTTTTNPLITSKTVTKVVSTRCHSKRHPIKCPKNHIKMLKNPINRFLFHMIGKTKYFIMTNHLEAKINLVSDISNQISAAETRATRHKLGNSVGRMEIV